MPRGQGHVAPVEAQRCLDPGCLRLRSRREVASRNLRDNIGGKMLQPDEVAVDQGRRMSQGVLEFANVAGPMVV